MVAIYGQVIKTRRNNRVIRVERNGLAYFAFALSAFSVPLLHQRRATLIQAVYASARVVLRNFFTSIAWGLLLTCVILISILLLPLLALTLPVMAFASFALYQRVFPQTETNGSIG